MKKITCLALTLMLLLTASGALAQKLVIGATPSPHEEILELIRDDLAEYGYELQIITFTEYPLPNPALSDGQLTANYFQHLPYLEDYNRTQPEGKKLYPAIPVHYEPFGLYPGRISSIDDLPEGGIVAITNDPTNETRALLMLEEAGLIKLPEGATPSTFYTVLDIVENPLNLDIREMDANLIPYMRQDVDLAVINGNFALDAGLSASTDAVFVESFESDAGKLYTNYVVVREEDMDADWVSDLEYLIRSEKVADFILENPKYKGGILPAFVVEYSDTVTLMDEAEDE